MDWLDLILILTNAHIKNNIKYKRPMGFSIGRLFFTILEVKKWKKRKKLYLVEYNHQEILR